MKLRHSLHEFMPYGAPDLLVAHRPDLSRALTVAASAAAAAFLLWLALLSLVPVRPQAVSVIPSFTIDPFVPHVPPQEVPKTSPPQARIRPAPPANALPRLVPDAPPQSTIPPEYGEWSKEVQPSTDGRAGAISGTVLDNPPPPAADLDDRPVKQVDEWPVAVTMVKPEYPQIARDAMVDGKVIVLVLVGRDGHVRDAKIEERHSVPMLDGVALEAARNWVFSPALVNGHPVSVWTAIPFDFILQ